MGRGRRRLPGQVMFCQGADQGLPTGLAWCLGGLFVREEVTGKVLLVA